MWKAPRGRGPYGIATTPGGDVYYASLAGSHIARIDTETGEATVIEPPTRDQGARRVWPDSKGRIWVSYWNTGHVGMYDPASRSLARVEAAGRAAARVFGLGRRAATRSGSPNGRPTRSSGSIRSAEKFESFPSDRAGANVRQMLGRAGEAWGAESGNARLVMVPARCRCGPGP